MNAVGSKFENATEIAHGIPLKIAKPATQPNQ